MTLMTRQENVPLTSRITITITNPALVAVMAEGQVVFPLIEKIEPMCLALEQGTPDMAIAMWDRIRRMIVDAQKSINSEIALIQKSQNNNARHIESENLDSVIGTLPTHDMLLHNIGRFRAYAFLVSAYATSRAVNRSPTAISNQLLTTIQGHHELLLAKLNEMIQTELQLHAKATGTQQLPPGEVRVLLTTSLTDPPSIVIEH